MMPPRMTRLKWHPVFTLFAVVFLVPPVVDAQTGRVTMQAHVSETVALSVLPNPGQGHDVEVLSSGNVVRITLRSFDAQAPAIRVPLLVRSNTSFKISATIEPATLSQLTVLNVRATGTLVSPLAISELKFPEQLDLETSGELLLVSGPRVSLGGTLQSPNNALQISVLIRLKSPPARGQAVQLMFVAAPQTQ
jgi:hypothetical protein